MFDIFADDSLEMDMNLRDNLLDIKQMYHEKTALRPLSPAIHCFGALLKEDDMEIGDDCEEVQLNMSLPKTNSRVLMTDDGIYINSTLFAEN